MHSFSSSITDHAKQVGQEGAVTPLHYDILHNIHFLISGKKTFDLYGPHLARALYPFPHLHPGARASQLTVDADFSRRCCEVYI